ncbi:hypothetical protein M885DRAFT_553312 [Pelagophyceae sp. CCMP2097]|nr:hypothetical protein M885DRAFT_553312 [Pelagophyceae sp. CCMP2097]
MEELAARVAARMPLAAQARACWTDAQRALLARELWGPEETSGTGAHGASLGGDSADWDELCRRLIAAHLPAVAEPYHARIAAGAGAAAEAALEVHWRVVVQLCCMSRASLARLHRSCFGVDADAESTLALMRRVAPVYSQLARPIDDDDDASEAADAPDDDDDAPERPAPAPPPPLSATVEAEPPRSSATLSAVAAPAAVDAAPEPDPAPAAAPRAGAPAGASAALAPPSRAAAPVAPPRDACSPPQRHAAGAAPMAPRPSLAAKYDKWAAFEDDGDDAGDETAALDRLWCTKHEVSHAAGTECARCAAPRCCATPRAADGAATDVAHATDVAVDAACVQEARLALEGARRLLADGVPPTRAIAASPAYDRRPRLQPGRGIGVVRHAELRGASAWRRRGRPAPRGGRLRGARRPRAVARRQRAAPRCFAAAGGAHRRPPRR